MSDQNQSQDELLVEALYAESGIDREQSLKSILENDVEFERTLEQLRSTKALVDALPEVRPDPQIHYAILRAARLRPIAISSCEWEPDIPTFAAPRFCAPPTLLSP